MLAKEKALYRLIFFAAIVERPVCNREFVKKVFWYCLIGIEFFGKNFDCYCFVVFQSRLVCVMYLAIPTFRYFKMLLLTTIGDCRLWQKIRTTVFLI